MDFCVLLMTRIEKVPFAHAICAISSQSSEITFVFVIYRTIFYSEYYPLNSHELLLITEQ